MNCHHRRSVRLRDYDYSEGGAYFITICTNNRNCLFGEINGGRVGLNECGEIVQTVWNGLDERFTNITTDQFIVMPNHVHGIVAIDSSNVGAIHELPLPTDKKHRRQMLLPKIVGYFKMNTAKRINELRKSSGTSVWQRNYHDRVIRNETELNNVRQYILDNPLKWETDPENPDAIRDFLLPCLT